MRKSVARERREAAQREAAAAAEATLKKSPRATAARAGRPPPNTPTLSDAASQEHVTQVQEEHAPPVTNPNFLLIRLVLLSTS